MKCYHICYIIILDITFCPQAAFQFPPPPPKKKNKKNKTKQNKNKEKKKNTKNYLFYLDTCHCFNFCYFDIQIYIIDQLSYAVAIKLYVINEFLVPINL